MVRDDQLEAEVFGECGGKEKVKISERGFGCGFIKRGGESDRDVVVSMGDAFKLPGFRAHQTVRRGTQIFGAGGKPREAHGHSTANRGAVLPLRFRADIECLISSSWLPRSDMRSVQTNFTGGTRRGHPHAGEPSAAVHDSGDTRNFKTAVQIAQGSRRCHRKPPY